MALVGDFGTIVPAGFASLGNILLWVVLRGGVAFLALLSWIGYKLWWLMVLPHAIVVDLVIDVVTSMGVMPRCVCQFADYERFAVAKCATVCSVALLGSCAAIEAIDGGVCVCVCLWRQDGFEGCPIACATCVLWSVLPCCTPCVFWNAWCSVPD